MLKKSVNMIYQVYQHTESHEQKKKNGESWICYSAQTV